MNDQISQNGISESIDEMKECDNMDHALEDGTNSTQVLHPLDLMTFYRHLQISLGEEELMP